MFYRLPESLKKDIQGTAKAILLLELTPYGKPLVAGEVPLFWTSDELAQNLLYCGGTKGFAQAPRVAWVKTGF